MKQTITSKRLIITSLAIASTISGMVFMSVASYAAPKPPKVYSATCSITNVPATLALGETMNPVLTITNTGTGNIHPRMITPVGTYGPTTYLKEKADGPITPGNSKSINLGKYTPTSEDAIGEASILSHSDLNYPGAHIFFDCVTDFTIVQ